MKTVLIKGKVFSTPHGREEHEASVSNNGDVRVLDPVSGTMTICHNLTERDLQRIRQAPHYSVVKL